MKVFILILIGAFVQSNAFLQNNVHNMTFIIDPKFGNISKDADNATHLGAIQMWIFKNVTNFTVELIFISDDSTLDSHVTVKPCESRVSKKLTNVRKTLGMDRPSSTSSLPGRSCPIHEGSVLVPAKERYTRLPVLIASYQSKPGRFLKNASLVIQTPKGPETILTVYEHFEILEVDE